MSPGEKMFFVVFPWVIAVYATLMAVVLISIMPPHMPRVAAICVNAALGGLVAVSWLFACANGRDKR